MDGVKVSTILRSLRLEYDNGKPISYNKLADALNERYGVRITEQTLKDYERAAVNQTTENITKGKAVFGMRVEYLDMFADFYGVPTDYILGRSEFSSPDHSVQSVCAATGLSEKSSKVLCMFQGDELKALDATIASAHFKTMIREFVKGGKSAGLQSEAIISVIQDALSSNPSSHLQALRPIIGESFDGIFRTGAINAANKLYDDVSEIIWEAQEKEAGKNGEH